MQQRLLKDKKYLALDISLERIPTQVYQLEKRFISTLMEGPAPWGTDHPVFFAYFCKSGDGFVDLFFGMGSGNLHPDAGLPPGYHGEKETDERKGTRTKIVKQKIKSFTLDNWRFNIYITYWR